MPSYSFKAYDETGNLINDIESAESEQQLKSLIKARKLRLVSFEQEKSANSSVFSFANKDKVTSADIEFVTAELSLLLESGVKIDKALQVLARAKNEGGLAKLLNTLSSDIRKGVPLSDALSKHDNVFDSLYVNLVRIGESSGELPMVFKGLARDLKYKKELNSKIIQAITYPSVIAAVCILSIVFVFNFVVPKLSVMFNDVAELPLYTQVLLSVSDWVQLYQFHVLILIVFIAIAIKWSKDNGVIEDQLDNTLLSLPLIGNGIQVIERIRFSSGMALMLSAGVKVDKALKLATKNIKNQVVRNRLAAVSDKVKKGESISNSLRQSQLFPELLVSLLEVGEESGNMSPIFNEISERSRNEFTSWTSRVTSLIEPVMILVMGGVVGAVVVVMLMSIVAVNDIGF